MTAEEILYIKEIKNVPIEFIAITRSKSGFDISIILKLILLLFALCIFEIYSSKTFWL